MLKMNTLVATLLLNTLRASRWSDDDRPELALEELFELGLSSEALDAWLDHFCMDDDGDDDDVHHRHIANSVARLACHSYCLTTLVLEKLLPRLDTLWPALAPAPAGWRVLLELLRTLARGFEDELCFAWMERARVVDVAFWLRGVPDDPRVVPTLHAIVDERAGAADGDGADFWVLFEALLALRGRRALTLSERSLYLKAAMRFSDVRRRAAATTTTRAA